MATPFKMKSSPTKGKLQDFFNTVGSQLKSNKRDIGGELKEKYNRTKESTPKAGESKYQASVRTRRATNKAKNKMIDEDKDGMSDLIQAPKPAPKGQKTVSTKPVEKKKVKVVKKPNSKITGAIGSKTRKEQYDAKGWKYDDTIKGYNRDGTEKKKGKFRVQLMVGEQSVSTDILRNMSKLGNINKTKQGTDMYTYHTPDFETQKEADAYLAEAKLSGFENAFIPSPTQKKSPSKKRGFRMNRKK